MLDEFMELSTIILTKDAEAKLEDCLKSVKDMGEIVVLDGGSTDKTLEIARNHKAKIIKQKLGSYDTWRNQGKEVARTDWIFYVDPDERVTPELHDEIRRVTRAGGPQGKGPAVGHSAELSRSLTRRNSRGAGERQEPSDLPVAYAVSRRNFVFGKELHHGGWWPDYVVRLMRKDALIRWEGELHEQPLITGQIGYLKHPLIHLKENNLSDMVAKTNKWSEIEAKLLLQSGHPKMVWWRFLRPVVGEVFDRLILKVGFLDGVEGVIFSIYQGYSVFMRYAKLWEMQLQNQKSKVKVQN